MKRMPTKKPSHMAKTSPQTKAAPFSA